MKFLIALALCASLHATDPFEGRVQFRSTNPKGKTSEMAYSMKGAKSRLDMPTPKRGMLSVIIDSDVKTTLMLVEEKKVAVKHALKEAPALPPGKSVITKTGRSASIAGYDCDEFVTKGDGGETHIWVTPGLGSFRHFEGGPMGSRAKVPRWERELADKGLFPLKLTDKGTTYEAIKVEKKSLEDSLFRAPADYKLIEK